jgi:hypothetical protein
MLFGATARLPSIRKSYFAHELWLNPLNSLWDFWRIFDRRFINKG